MLKYDTNDFVIVAVRVGGVAPEIVERVTDGGLIYPSPPSVITIDPTT